MQAMYRILVLVEIPPYDDLHQKADICKNTVQLFLMTALKNAHSFQKLIVTAGRMLAFAFGTAVQISVGRMFFSLTFLIYNLMNAVYL